MMWLLWLIPAFIAGYCVGLYVGQNRHIDDNSTFGDPFV